METLYLNLITPFIGKLIPNTEVKHKKLNLATFNVETTGLTEMAVSHAGKKIFLIKNASGNVVSIYIESVSCKDGFKLEISRKSIPFSKFEYYLLKQIPLALGNSLISSSDPNVYTPE